MKNFSRAAVLSLMLAGLVEQANAAGVDVTAVTTGISDAQTAIMSVIAALLGLSVAVFGIAKIQRFVSRKAGA